MMNLSWRKVKPVRVTELAYDRQGLPPSISIWSWLTSSLISIINIVPAGTLVELCNCAVMNK